MKIGIIEDDMLLNQSLKIRLQKEGYQILCMHTQKEAEEKLTGMEDLLIIDIGLPDGNGLDFYRKLSEKCSDRKLPALFLTARDEEQDMLNAFDSGAEDYVVKPFSMNVLLKRIAVILKRSKNGITEERLLQCQGITLYPDKKQVLVNGKELSLTAREYRLLEYFMENKGQVLTKENILEHIWGIDGQYVVDNNVSVLINRLRKKLEAADKETESIRNVFGLGYRMEDDK